MPDEKLPWRFRTPPTQAERIEERIKTAADLKASVERLKVKASMAAMADAETRRRCRFTTEDGIRCRDIAIIGTRRCVTHTTGDAKTEADARLRAMVGPALQRLETLVHQNTNLTVSVNAIDRVLNRALGAVGKDTDADKRPQIRIAIAVGGVPLPGSRVSVVDVPAELPPGDPPPPEDDEPMSSFTPEMEKAMREDD